MEEPRLSEQSSNMIRLGSSTASQKQNSDIPNGKV